MKPKLIPEMKSGKRGYASVTASIYGFQQCCSAAILHGVGGYARQITLPPKPPPGQVPVNWQTMDISPVQSFAQWMKERSKKSNAFLLPYDYAMCAVLEKLYIKASTGEGGNNMYASSSYCTKTWFIADRKRMANSLTCMGFMNWLKKQGVQKVGRIHISPYRPGAHGGKCKGAVFAPDERRIEAFLKKKLAELNAHASCLFAEFNCTTKNTGVNAAATDRIGDLW